MSKIFCPPIQESIILVRSTIPTIELVNGLEEELLEKLLIALKSLR